jgi:hypothetical protein
MRVSKLGLGIMMFSCGLFLMGFSPKAHAEDASSLTLSGDTAKGIKGDHQDIKADKAEVKEESAAVKADRQTLKDAEASGDQTQIKAAKEQLRKDLHKDRAAKRDLNKDKKEVHQDQHKRHHKAAN